MCKPSCCPGENSGSGLGITLAALAGLAFAWAIARAVIHVVEVIAQAVVVITAAAVLAVTLAAAVAAVVIRARPARYLVSGPPAQLRLRTARAVGPPAPTWARAAISARISALGPASSCQACGRTPGERGNP